MLTILFAIYIFIDISIYIYKIVGNDSNSNDYDDDSDYYVSGPPEDFYYTNQGEDAYIDNVDDASQFQETKDAMELLGIYSESQRMMFRVLAAILHLGNVQISKNDKKEDETQVEVRVIGLIG